MQTRRIFLTAGAGCAVLALGAASYRAWDRGVWSGGRGSAYAPWGEWQGDMADGVARPLRAAILAANPHDTQPWLFAAGGNTVTLFADRARNLGTFDPFRREMHLGLGAALENLVLAAAAFGFTSKVTLTEGALSLIADDRPLSAVQIEFTPMTPMQSDLFKAIPDRHTNRGPYSPDRAIGPENLRRFTELVTDQNVRIVFIEDGHARGELGALIVEATERIVGDPRMSADSARWFRTGRRDIASHRDGVTVDTAGASAFTTAVSKLLPDLAPASADRYWLSMTRETQVPTAPVLGMILVRDRLDMGSAIQAGRAWQRLHLAATAKGFAAQPLNQPVECIDRDVMLGRPDGFGPAIAKFAEAPGWEPTFMFRLGVAEQPASPSPRRGLSEVLRTI